MNVLNKNGKVDNISKQKGNFIRAVEIIFKRSQMEKVEIKEISEIRVHLVLSADGTQNRKNK